MGYVRDRWKDPARKGKGRRWQVKYRVDGVEKDGGSFDNQAVAKRALAELEAAANRGQWVDTSARTTVAEWAREWADLQAHKPATARRVSGQIANHIEARAIGRRRLVALRHTEVQAWVNELSAAGLSPSTVRLQVALLRTILRAAVKDRRIASSPADDLALPDNEQPRIVPLTTEQVRQLADAVQPRYRAAVFAQAGLGLRLGELLALRVGDVDFLRRTVRVEWQLQEGTRDRIAPKTGRSRRTIPLPSVVADELARHIAEWPPLDDGTLFYSEARRPLVHAHYSGRVFAPAVRRLAAEGFPADTTTHDLRHHYASVLLAAGESVVHVADLLGHKSAALVLSTYGHVMPSSEDRARRAIDGAWSDPPVHSVAERSAAE